MVRVLCGRCTVVDEGVIVVLWYNNNIIIPLCTVVDEA